MPFCRMAVIQIKNIRTDMKEAESTSVVDSETSKTGSKSKIKKDRVETS